MSKKRPAATDARDLTDMRRGPHITARAAEYLMRRAREHGIPNAISRTSHWRARTTLCAEEDIYGPLVQNFTLPLTSGDKVCAIQSPAAMLLKALQTCEPFRVFFNARYEAITPTAEKKWHLIMYADEVGQDPLKVDDRKCECVYYSFLEFGGRALATEPCWFKVMVCRSFLVQDLPAGMSYLCSLLLERVFYGAHDLREGLVLPGGMVLFAEFDFFICDEKALKETLIAKGAGGFRLCPCCFKTTIPRRQRSARQGASRESVLKETNLRRSFKPTKALAKS